MPDQKHTDKRDEPEQALSQSALLEAERAEAAAWEMLEEDEARLCAEIQARMVELQEVREMWMRRRNNVTRLRKLLSSNGERRHE